MSNNTTTIMNFVESMKYSAELKKHIQDNLPEWIEKMEEIFENNPNNDKGQQTILSYTLLSMVVKMRDFYTQGKIDSLKEINNEE